MMHDGTQLEIGECAIRTDTGFIVCTVDSYSITRDHVEMIGSEYRIGAIATGDVRITFEGRVLSNLSDDPLPNNPSYLLWVVW